MYSINDGFLTLNGCYTVFKKEIGIPLAKRYLNLYFYEIDGFYKEKKFSWDELNSGFIEMGIFKKLIFCHNLKNENLKKTFLQKDILPYVELILNNLLNPISVPDLHKNHVENQKLKFAHS
jgi:hypothetical protein